MRVLVTAALIFVSTALSGGGAFGAETYYQASMRSLHSLGRDNGRDNLSPVPRSVQPVAQCSGGDHLCHWGNHYWCCPKYYTCGAKNKCYNPN